ncbi:DUF3224 domain-containing protein [Solicola gregarius]|uniref:DUF3224 domain-containing protein n=1 Tax=Solicola gregarius TaxID=2908642 RepID=A0AA46TGU6_9ACTN|nr:DUF3224 domain-containing protein [Solicola gregarius]UYM04283.1 DUF3224 domain-containing protein [Solicola gregarius]
MTYAHEATSRFTVAAWSEAAFVDIDGEGTTMGDAYYPSRGLSKADVTYSYAGEIEGTSTVAYLISYKAGAAPLSGFERFEGTIGGHDGSCVLRHTGSHTGEGVEARVEVVPGMGTGGLVDLRGEAQLRIAGHSDDGYELVLTYDL